MFSSTVEAMDLKDSNPFPDLSSDSGGGVFSLVLLVELKLCASLLLFLDRLFFFPLMLLQLFDVFMFDVVGLLITSFVLFIIGTRPYGVVKKPGGQTAVGLILYAGFMKSPAMGRGCGTYPTGGGGGMNPAAVLVDGGRHGLMYGLYIRPSDGDITGINH